MRNYLWIMAVLKVVGEIKTRKRIQKMVYLLQQKGAMFDESFSFHHYGPYSTELQIELDQLQSGDLIEQSFDGESYRFCLTKQGEELLSHYKGQGIEKRVASKHGLLIKELNSFSPTVLEMVATIVYFQKTYGKNRGKLKRILREIKPNLIGQFDRAWKVLDEKGLHASSRS